jgi:hypothetical protein
MTNPPSPTCPTLPARRVDHHPIAQLAALGRGHLTSEEKVALEGHLHRLLSYIEKLS